MGKEGRVGMVVSVRSYDFVVFRITCHCIYEEGGVGRVSW